MERLSELFERARGDEMLGPIEPRLGKRLREIRIRNGGNIGLFFVNACNVERAFVDTDAEIFLDSGDAYLELDLRIDATAARADIVDSLKGVAHYLSRKDDAEYVLGVTYGKIADLASRFGFRRSGRPGQFAGDAFVKKNYGRTPRGQAGKPMNGTFLMFMSRGDFLKRYLQEQSNETR